MITKRIIPCLDIREGRVVKGINFVDIKDAGDPVALAEIYNEEGADELTFLDITASYERRDIILNTVKKVAAKIFIPFTVGGGIKSVDDARNILKNGADKIAINSSAVLNPKLISEIANNFGNQSVVLAIDAKKNSNGYDVYINGGRVPMGIDAVTWAQNAVRLGAGEILLTSMDRDGTRKGFDLELTEKISETVKVPVIASGGAGKFEDFTDVFIRGKADAAIAASLFHFGEMRIRELKKFLKNKKIDIRS